MPTLPLDRPPTAAELQTLKLEDLRADPLLAEALTSFAGRTPERANALTFYTLSLKPPLAEAVARIVGERERGSDAFERPSLRLAPADLPTELLQALRAAVRTNNLSTLNTLVRELRASIAQRLEDDVLPELYRSEVFNKAIDTRIAKANADPVGHLLTALDAPAERWATLKPLLTTYYKDALVREKIFRPERALPSWFRTEKAMLALVKIVPRVKLEPLLKKYKVPYLKPLLLDWTKLADKLELPEAHHPALRVFADKFNRASGKAPLDQVRLVNEIVKLCEQNGIDTSPEAVYKAMKLSKKT